LRGNNIFVNVVGTNIRFSYILVKRAYACTNRNSCMPLRDKHALAYTHFKYVTMVQTYYKSM